MRISSVNQSNPKIQPNFQAKLEKKFVKDVYRFCQQRVLPIQMEKFEKKLVFLGNMATKILCLYTKKFMKIIKKYKL